MSVIIQQDATEYSLFKSVSCSTCFGWYFTHHQELITLYLQYVALMRPVLLPVVNVAGPRSQQVADLFHADGRADMAHLIVAFRNSLKAPNKQINTQLNKYSIHS